MHANPDTDLDRPLNKPYISICIPQYNRTDFLIAACRSFERQSFRDFEICISDDCSTDGQEAALAAYLAGSGMRYVYRRNQRNLRYDGNLRSAIGLSGGKYILLMGNDDGLASQDVLQELHDKIESVGGAAVAIANYREVQTGRVYQRMSRTELLGSGPEVAVATFRDYSFVSGIVFDGERARSIASSVVDGSEMYQMYLGARLIAEGGQFLSIADVMVDKDLQVPGQEVDSYRQRSRVDPCPIVKRPLPMGRLLEVVSAGLKPSVDGPILDALLYKAGRSLYLYTYAFWAIEYRRVQSWRYSLGVLLALSPFDIAAGQRLSLLSLAKLWLLYMLLMASGLLTPIVVFDRARPLLYRLAKRSR